MRAPKVSACRLLAIIARSDQPFSTSGVGSKADIDGPLLTQFSFVSTRPRARFVLVAPARSLARPSAPGPARRAFLQEGAHALGAVLGGEGAGQDAALLF